MPTIYLVNGGSLTKPRSSGDENGSPHISRLILWSIMYIICCEAKFVSEKNCSRFFQKQFAFKTNVCRTNICFFVMDGSFCNSFEPQASMNGFQESTMFFILDKNYLSLLFYFSVRYSPNWSAEKMHRSVSVYPKSKLINICSNHYHWPVILSHVTSNHISEISVTPQSHSLTDLVKSTIDNYLKLPGYELQRHR